MLAVVPAILRAGLREYKTVGAVFTKPGAKTEVALVSPNHNNNGLFLLTAMTMVLFQSLIVPMAKTVLNVVTTMTPLLLWTLLLLWTRPQMDRFAVSSMPWATDDGGIDSCDKRIELATDDGVIDSCDKTIELEESNVVRHDDEGGRIHVRVSEKLR